jgi:PAS domain S-box-containing protein
MKPSEQVRVLLVEDDPGEATLVRIILETTNEPRFDLTHATSLHQAIDCVKESSADVILLDLSLPDSRGIKTFERMREAAPDSPIIILTGLDDQKTIRQAMQLGAQDYLVKDATLEHILARVIHHSIMRMAGINERERIYSQLVKANEQIAQDRQSLRSIIWGTGAGTWEWNVQTGETRFNDRWAEIIGYSLEEISPVSIETWLRFAHPEDLKKSEEALNRHFSGEVDHYKCEARMCHKDGRWIWVLDRGRVVSRSADGQVLWMSGTHIEISERKQAEEEIRALTSFQAAILENIPVGIVVAKPDRTVTHVNNAFAQLFQAEAKDIIGKSSKTLFFDEDQFHKIGSTVYPHVLGGKTFTEDTRVRRKDGEEIWVHVQTRLIDQAMPEQGIVFSVTDITERREFEAWLTDYNAELERRVVTRTEDLRQMAIALTLAEERERRAIAADLHDELGQELHIARIKLDSIENGLAGNVLVQVPLNDLKRHLAHSSAMVRSLTSQLSPPALKDLGLVPALSWLVEELKRVYGLNIRLVNEGGELKLSMAQSTILFRAIRELLLNVFKHAQVDEAKLYLSLESDGLSITVEDSGVGMSHAYTDTTQGGRFGLSNIRERMTFLGGSFNVQSQHGKGTTVTLFLPLDQNPVRNVETDNR